MSNNKMEIVRYAVAFVFCVLIVLTMYQCVEQNHRHELACFKESGSKACYAKPPAMGH